MKRRFLWYDLVALVLLLFGSFLIIGAHFFVQGPVYDTRYPGQVMKPFGTALYPLHVDGWNHLSQTKQLIEEKGYIGLNPQLGTEEGYTSYEKGYHVFLALVLLVTGISLTQLALVVPPLVFFLGAFTLYLFFSRALLKPVAGLFSIAGLSVLTNDIHVLGFWFLVPLNFSLLFISLTLVTLFLTPKTYRWYFSGFLFFLSLFIYPLVSVFLLLFNGLFFFFEYKKEIIHFLKRLTHYQKVILWIGISFLFLLAIGVVRRFLIFPENWVVFNGFYSLFSLIWWPLIPFAGVGLFFLYKNYGDLFFSFLLIMMFTFFNALVFSLHQIGILIPYQRMLYFAELFLVILISLGASVFLEWVSGYFTRKKLLFLVLSSLVILTLFSLTLPSYYAPRGPDYNLQYFVHDEQVSLLSELETSQSYRVLSDPYFATAIYPLSIHHAAAAVDANLGGGNVNLYSQFTEVPCSVRWQLVKENSVDFVITDFPVECTFLRPLLQEGDYVLYVVTSDQRVIS